MIRRMSMDDLFPRASYGEEPLHLGLFNAAFLDPCWVCGRVTAWVSLAFECHMCSVVCEELAWSRYWIADAIAAGDPLWEKTHEAPCYPASVPPQTLCTINQNGAHAQEH